MGTLGGELEFSGLFCSCWQDAGPGREVISLAVWGAAAGVWSERLGANTAVVLHGGQQVQFWLWGLEPGENKLNKCVSVLLGKICENL